ncbi:MAG: 5-bromo-4-chloroindolyl phosphate hydrolysis family protein [Oscillospiraceae bacterium]|nr:5-bromo-4-chloroindolyl phosphate hydrolysis family protein [Oscillospiraceae bacterium]
MREIKHPSVIPFYCTAAVWLLYALLFPMYRPLDFVIFLAAGVAAFLVLRLVFPGTVERIELPIETGDANIDALLAEGRAATAEMTTLYERARDGSTKKKIGEIITVTDKIFRNLADDNWDYRMVRRFTDFYLPTIIKLLRTYDKFSADNISGENIAGTLSKIDDALSMILTSCEKQYDALFHNQALDIETDITVLEQLLKKDGLTDAELTASPREEATATTGA